jgi:molecular chaperone DnaK (HSP70)
MNIIKQILVGIDFGTTNTVITHFINNKAVVLNDGIFKIIPSKIGKQNGKLYCGNYIPLKCWDIIHSFKISIGTNTTFAFDDDIYTHNDLLIIFFKHLYDIIYRTLICKDNQDVNTTIVDNNFIIKAVITVPSNFNDTQRDIIKNSFISVGFDILRIINEPSAAALSYGLNYSVNEEELILVIDTGGGTMDFTILQKSDMFFEVIHSQGITLGGDDFTKVIIEDIKKTTNIMNINNTVWNQAQLIKEKLTYLDNYEIKLNDNNYNLSKNTFENLSKKLITNIETVLTKIITDFPLINYVILVGGTNRIPILQQTIKRITKKNYWIHPDMEYIVAQGAGLYAGIIENKYSISDDVILLDVLPLSLGVELADGSYSIIIPKNTPLPVRRTQKYTTDSPGDNIIKIKVYQGERLIANKNFLIGEIIFDKLTIGAVPIIEISFKVDLNSIIHVTITDKKSGIEKCILIKNNPIDIMTDDNTLTISEIDELELQKIQNIYLIKTHITNALIHLQYNDKITEENKTDILNKFQLIEEELDTMNPLQLIETIKLLQDNYSLLCQSNKVDEVNNTIDEIDCIFYNERKQTLQNRANLLLAKNPLWAEHLQAIIEKLSYCNITIDYINDKLLFLDELEKDNTEEKDYKQEYINLCTFLKNELIYGSIDLDENRNKLLTDLINDHFINIHTNNIVDANEWKCRLNTLNKQCDDIYNI